MYSESELIFPALRFINSRNGVTTSQILAHLRETLKPTGEDLIILDNRNDDKFSQKVRNLKSHNTFERMGLADYYMGKFYGTKVGRTHVKVQKDVDVALTKQGFKGSSTRKILSNPKARVFVEEGYQYVVTQNVRKRSRKLRDAAFEHCKNEDGTIECVGCGFEATAVYGSDFKGLINMHHTKPLSVTGRVKGSLDVLLKDIVPVCPTCHAVIHHNPNKVLTIKELKAYL